jgi:putative transposase
MAEIAGAQLVIKSHRRSIRLPHYDYSQAGAYFVTVCVEGRKCLLGEITDGKVWLKDAGRMIMKWGNELENKFPAVEIDEMAIMPNHFHGILALGDMAPAVGAALRGRPRKGHPRRGAPTNAYSRNLILF